MRTTGNAQFWRFAQPAKRCMSAIESPPPETASAASHPGKNPRSVSARAKRLHRSQLRLLALVAGALGFGARRDTWRGIGIFGREGGKGGTTFLHLPEFEKRKAKLQHAVRRSLGLGIFLQQLREIPRGLRVIFLGRVGDVTRPI